MVVIYRTHLYVFNFHFLADEVLYELGIHLLNDIRIEPIFFCPFASALKYYVASVCRNDAIRVTILVFHHFLDILETLADELDNHLVDAIYLIANFGYISTFRRLLVVDGLYQNCFSFE